MRATSRHTTQGAPRAGGSAQPPRSRRALRAATIIAVASITVATSACGAASTVDPFYLLGTDGATASSPASGSPSANSPSRPGSAPTSPGRSAISALASPGEVIGRRPARFTQDPFGLTPAAGVRSTQVMYWSTDVHGRRVAVSGTVLVPEAPWPGPGSRPLVTYGPGTRGVGDQCAPSITLANGTDYESGVFLDALQRGWAVAVSDMIGLGTPGRHHYEVGQEQGMAVLDIARAAQRVDGSGLDAASPIGIWGYSQGGTSAGWAAQLAGSYAPELRVVGTAAGGVPADLRVVARNLDGNPFFSLLPLAALGYDAAYPELDFDSFLNENGRRLRDRVESFCVVDMAGIGTFLDLAGHWMSEYFTAQNPLDSPEWIAALDANRLGAAPPSAPVLMQHSLFDQVIPREQAVALRATWCAAGANIAWRDLPGEHALGLPLSVPASLDFLGARFAGVAAPDGCTG